jgi:DNA-binding NarL/FixJ family response regulator
MKVILVDDHVMFREVLRKVCTEELLCNVIAETESGSRAIELIRDSRPDLVILDLCIKDCDGFDVLKQGRVSHLKPNS